MVTYNGSSRGLIQEMRTSKLAKKKKQNKKPFLWNKIKCNVQIILKQLVGLEIAINNLEGNFKTHKS